MEDKELKIHKTFLNIAKEISNLSHCVSHKVGVVLVKDGRILSTGINGTPAGFKNCDEVFDEKDFSREEHHRFSENYEIHAETNAILFAAQNDISIKGATLYSTLHPCNHCLKMICNSGIKEIYYSDEYDLFDYDADIKNMLTMCGVHLHHIS